MKHNLPNKSTFAPDNPIIKPAIPALCLLGVTLAFFSPPLALDVELGGASPV